MIRGAISEPFRVHSHQLVKDVAWYPIRSFGKYIFTIHSKLERCPRLIFYGVLVEFTCPESATEDMRPHFESIFIQ